jgi:DNA modification methylase
MTDKAIKNNVVGGETLAWDILKTYEFNNLKEENRDVSKLKNAIVNGGFSFPIYIWHEHRYVIDGKGRDIALSELEKEGYIIPDLPVSYIEAANKSEAKKLTLQASSKHGEITPQSFADFSIDLELEPIDFEMFDLGLGELSIDDVDIGEPHEGLTDDDAVPEEPVKPRTKLGDVWLCGNHRVMCGDSTSIDAVDKLMNGKKADMVFTDPPYGIDYSGGRTQVVNNKDYGKLKNDALIGDELGKLICNIFLQLKPEADVYICVSPIMQKPFLDFIESQNRKVDAVIVWDKKNAGLGYMAYRRQCEFILFCKGGKFKKGDKSDFDLWSISKDNATTYVHGTQKPVAVPCRGIENSSKQGDAVLDLFGGSGSTLIACEKTNRTCYMMELDEKYCDVIVERYEAYSGKDAILESTGKKYKDYKNDKDLRAV